MVMNVGYLFNKI